MACWFFDFVLTELSLCVAATFVLKPVIFFFFNNYSVCMIFGMVILCSALSFFLFLFFFLDFLTSLHCLWANSAERGSEGKVCCTVSACI